LISAKDPSKGATKPTDKQAVKKVPEKKQKAAQIKPLRKTKDSKAKLP